MHAGPHETVIFLGQVYERFWAVILQINETKNSNSSKIFLISDYKLVIDSLEDKRKLLKNS